MTYTTLDDDLNKVGDRYSGSSDTAKQRIRTAFRQLETLEVENASLLAEVTRLATDKGSLRAELEESKAAVDQLQLRIGRLLQQVEQLQLAQDGWGVPNESDPKAPFQPVFKHPNTYPHGVRAWNDITANEITAASDGYEGMTYRHPLDMD